MNFSKAAQNGAVEGFCLIKTIDIKKTAKGIPFLDMTLTDSSGEINAKLWDYKEEAHGTFSVNMLVKIRGTITVFNDSEQLRVERIRPVSDRDEVNIEDYVPSSEYSGEKMLGEIERIVDGFNNEDIKTITKELIKRNREQLVYWPAAFRLHHAIRGGLLYHTLSMLRIAQSVSEVYDCIDKDLLFAGVILHDIAKIKEFEVSSAGVVSSYTVKGNLIGHLVMGAMEIDRIGKELGINEETLMLLEHMLISHHGEPEFGAAVRPMFIEAEVLSEIDLLDARIYEMSQSVGTVAKGEFTQKMWAMDNRKLYNHTDREIAPKAYLFKEEK